MAEAKKPKLPKAPSEELSLELDNDLKIESGNFPVVDTQSFLDQELGAAPVSLEAPPAIEMEAFDNVLGDVSAKDADFGNTSELSDSLSLPSPGLAIPEVESPKVESPAMSLDITPSLEMDLPASEETAFTLDAAPASDFQSPEPAVTESPRSEEDMSVLKRYGSLKEREAREKEATVQVLRRQVEQLETRLQKSEGERRRVTMKLQEVESTFKAVQEAREQDRHHLSKSGDQHQEDLRALQLRLDNAQFQATKAEKKLEEFRERVRHDIQKIRLRERELANRLELQKRDAEALLAAKDERLLQQKRDIDRLEFEIETLQERLVDETHRAEDRTKKLSRALQSLRLAEGMLSGIQEEVLPNAGGGSEGEAA